MKTVFFNNPWEKGLLYALFLILYAVPTSLQAQTVGKTYRKPAPGIYIMTQLCGEDGQYQSSPFEQYKFVDKNRNLYGLMFRGNKLQRGEGGQTAFMLHKEEYTSRVSGETSPVQVFDTKKKKFKLKWFQNLSFYKLFPKGTFVTEQWEAVGRTSAAGLLKDVIATKTSKKNPLLGAWKLVGTSECIHNSTPSQDKCIVPTYRNPKSYLLKIYGKEASVLIPPMGQTHRTESNSTTDKNSDIIHIVSGTIRYTEHYDKNTTKENGTPCHIEWIDDNTIKLIYQDTQTGKTYHEIWERFTQPVQLGF